MGGGGESHGGERRKRYSECVLMHNNTTAKQQHHNVPCTSHVWTHPRVLLDNILLVPTTHPLQPRLDDDVMITHHEPPVAEKSERGGTCYMY